MDNMVEVFGLFVGPVVAGVFALVGLQLRESNDVKLERLVEIRKSFVDGTSSADVLDRKIELLAFKVGKTFSIGHAIFAIVLLLVGSLNLGSAQFAQGIDRWFLWYIAAISFLMSGYFLTTWGRTEWRIVREYGKVRRLRDSGRKKPLIKRK